MALRLVSPIAPDGGDKTLGMHVGRPTKIVPLQQNRMYASIRRGHSRLTLVWFDDLALAFVQEIACRYFLEAL